MPTLTFLSRMAADSPLATRLFVDDSPTQLQRNTPRHEFLTLGCRRAWQSEAWGRVRRRLGSDLLEGEERWLHRARRCDVRGAWVDSRGTGSHTSSPNVNSGERCGVSNRRSGVTVCR